MSGLLGFGYADRHLGGLVPYVVSTGDHGRELPFQCFRQTTVFRRVKAIAQQGLLFHVLTSENCLLKLAIRKTRVEMSFRKVLNANRVRPCFNTEP